MMLTLAEIAKQTGCSLIGDEAFVITGVADLESATPSDASFLASAAYLGAAKKSAAGVIFVDRSAEQVEGKQYLVSDNPSLSFQMLLDILRPAEYLLGFKGIHPTAIVHETAHIAENVTLGPYVVIDKDASIGEGTILYPHCYVGVGTVIGTQCLFYPNATVRERCIIGNRVILQQGAVIGSCGYGYLTGKNGIHTKLTQHGNVVIEDDVEIGAHTTIDRARFDSTRIGKGTKIDNQVQIAHGTTIGSHNLIVAQVGIAGSTSTGNNVVIGGQAGIGGHITIGSNIMIAARSGVLKSIKDPGKYGGTPAIPLRDHQRHQVVLRNIDKIIQRIVALEKKEQ